jgi:Cdc6-like AAA superfamily ATPase
MGITTACSASTHRRSGFVRVYEKLMEWLSLRASFPSMDSSHVKAHEVYRFDPRIWIKKNLAPAANASGGGATKDDGLAIAGARGTGKAMTSKLSVEIVNEEDNEARRQEKQSEANAKRYAYLSVNPLPIVLKSVWL